MMLVKALLLAMVLNLTLSWMAGADGAATPPVDDTGQAASADGPDAATDAVLPGFQKLDVAQSYLSRNIESLSRSIDAFFGDDRIYEEESGTYLQFRGSTIYREDGAVDFDSQFRGRIDLPNLEKKLALIIESDADSTIAQNNIAAGQPKVLDSLDERQASASLQYIVKELKDWNVRLLPGIRLTWPPDTLLKLRLRNQQKLDENWLSRFTLTPGWFSDHGWEVRGLMDLERQVGPDALFRASSEAIWLADERHNFDLAQVFTFAHPLSRRDLMAYTIGLTAVTYPSLVATSYFGNVRYRRNIHRHWLFLEIRPQVAFEREDDFRLEPSMALTLEILFGSRYIAYRKGA